MEALITGAGGMIGGHLVKRLLADGHGVRAVDIKPIGDWWQTSAGAENLSRWDVRDQRMARGAVDGVDWVFHLACPMGGIGWITTQMAECSKSAAVTTAILEAAADADVSRFLLTSSACVYRADRQTDAAVVALKESDAWPADPEPGYGLSKLYEEELCRYFMGDRARIPRLHNAYGTFSTWVGGKEKAPAAICRKVAEVAAGKTNLINVWGDGQQTRSFMAMDDCIEGIMRIMASDCSQPLNLGSTELVTVNELIDIVERIAGITPGSTERVYQLGAPQGVRGRNSDNTLILKTLDWEPTIPLEVGLGPLYEWILEQVTTTSYERNLFY